MKYKRLQKPKRRKKETKKNKNTKKTNVFSRAFRIGNTREELKQQLHNFCVRFIEIKASHYPTISKEDAKSHLEKYLKLENSLNPTGLTIEQLEYRVRKARNMLLALRRRIKELEQPTQ